MELGKDARLGHVSILSSRSSCWRRPGITQALTGTLEHNDELEQAITVTNAAAAATACILAWTWQRL